MPTTHDRLGCPCGRRTANPEHRRRLHEVAAGSDAGQQFLVPIVPDADNLDLDLALLDEVDKVAGIPLREQQRVTVLLGCLDRRRRDRPRMGGTVGQARAKSLKPELDAGANSLLLGLLRAASWRIVALLARPATPEVAGSSPVAPI
jgi:hypothetical protein